MSSTLASTSTTSTAAGASRRADRLAERHPQHVGPIGKLARARRRSRSRDEAHGRQRAELVDDGGQDRRARRRRQLALPLGEDRDVAPAAPPSPGAGTGTGPCAVRTTPRPHDGRQRADRRRRQMHNRRRDADDVGDRVVGAHLVKGDPIDAGAVQLRLDLGDAGENVPRQRAHVGVEPRALEQTLHLRVVAVLVGARGRVRVMAVRPMRVIVLGVRVAFVSMSVVAVELRRPELRPGRWRRCRCPGQVTSKLRPTKAPRLRLPKRDAQPADPHRLDGAFDDAAGTPASTSAATAMSPAIPDVGSKCRCRPRPLTARRRLGFGSASPPSARRRNRCRCSPPRRPPRRSSASPSSAATPPKLAPYPMLVGTAITGRAKSPADHARQRPFHPGHHDEDLGARRSSRGARPAGGGQPRPRRRSARRGCRPARRSAPPPRPPAGRRFRRSPRR